MLAQHLITKPIFEAIFENYSFAANNPVSLAMQRILDLLERDGEVDQSAARHLKHFYDTICRDVRGIKTSSGKQYVIKELYEQFFKKVFPRTVEKLGIVYTPIEIVDFILQSVAEVLQREFGRDISDEDVHIIDPFVGTGTFIARLISSGLIRPEDLPRKYAGELHANEIVLLAYYVACINIEHAFHEATASDGYVPFGGICLTDTFQLGENQDKFPEVARKVFPKNSQRVEAQQKAKIQVIIGNPPYSVGQKSANDNAQNQKYQVLENRIKSTYAKLSQASLVKGLYDSYIKAFRWASDRLDPQNGGVICFITNSQWLEGNAQDGFRKSLEREFDKIYVFNLRGAIRGRDREAAKKEGPNVFNIMTGVAITMLVKHPASPKNAKQIHPTPPE